MRHYGHPAVAQSIEELNGPFFQIHFLDLTEEMIVQVFQAGIAEPGVQL